METELLYYQVTIGEINSKLETRRGRSSLQEGFSEKWVMRSWVEFLKNNLESAFF